MHETAIRKLRATEWSVTVGTLKTICETAASSLVVSRRWTRERETGTRCEQSRGSRGRSRNDDGRTNINVGSSTCLSIL